MYKRLAYYFEIIFKFIFDIIDPLISNKKYIVFSTRAGRDYADNSKILFEEFLDNGIETVYFYTKKKSILKKIPKNGIYAYSFKGAYILLRAKILIFTHGSGDFFPYNPNQHKNRKFINLFHAIGVKKVGFLNSKKNIEEVNKWDYFVVSSNFEANFIKEQFQFNDEQIITIGQPRNDKLALSKKKTRNIILYAPTFRDDTLTQLFPFQDFNLKSLDEMLEVNNLEIMIRVHINDQIAYKNMAMFEDAKNIYFTGSDKIPTVNSILPEISMLISDYSSITLDFLLINRPIAYIPYDYERYNKTRGFSFNYHKYLAGPKITSQKEFEQFLTSSDAFSEKRKELLKTFHQFQDGSITKRLFHFIQNL
ncbi:MAG: CDP-glycerol glycerophosphotransferase family protein [Flavobacteriales bacterium]